MARRGTDSGDKVWGGADRDGSIQKDERPTMFKNIANFASLMRQAQQLGGKLQEVNDQLRSQRVIGTAGGGLIEAEVNGLGEMLSLRIAPQLLADGDQDVIESLAPAAVNQALEKAKAQQAEAMQAVMGNVGLPGIQDALSQLTGSTPGDDGSNPRPEGTQR